MPEHVFLDKVNFRWASDRWVDLHHLTHFLVVGDMHVYTSDFCYEAVTILLGHNLKDGPLGKEKTEVRDALIKLYEKMGEEEKKREDMREA